MIMTVTLAAGAQRMAQGKVIVKRLAAIENLGTMDVLCSDKTGTLHAWRAHAAVGRGCPRRTDPRTCCAGRASTARSRAACAVRWTPRSWRTSTRPSLRTRSGRNCRSTSSGEGSACWPAAQRACRC